jgi:hypothetical protein
MMQLGAERSSIRRWKYAKVGTWRPKRQTQEFLFGDEDLGPVRPLGVVPRYALALIASHSLLDRSRSDDMNTAWAYRAILDRAVQYLGEHRVVTYKAGWPKVNKDGGCQ